MESRETLHDTAIAAIAESCLLKREDLKPDLSLLELGLDSMVILSIVTTFENSLQRRFDPDDLLVLFEAESVAELTERMLALAEDDARG